jgi:UTP--glucose-1-phosphate uridylyltransferase
MKKNELQSRLARSGMPAWAIDEFLSLYEKYFGGPDLIVDWDAIQAPADGNLIDYASLSLPGEHRSALDRLAVCKLNGGLGTSMGCPGPKSLIPVKDGKTFLDLVVDHLSDVNHTSGVSIPLLLMNSFYTETETALVIEGYRGRLPIRPFLQNKFPRFSAVTGEILDESHFGVEAWYPPGHGDFYWCLDKQGLLDDLLREGKEFLFVANIDNLGATIDPRILGLMVEKDIPFLMEVTDKTEADVKGGSLYWDGDRFRLLEIARVPEDRLDEFYRSEKFRIFNTNNLWINLKHLRRRLDQGPLDLDIIANRKKIGNGVEAVQLETAIGNGLEHFPGAYTLRVGRERFRPVKKTGDLLLIQSNLFLQEHGRLVLNPARKIAGLPKVQLGDTFLMLEDYLRRFPAIPDLLGLESLVLEGDVRFETDVVLQGQISIIADKNPYLVTQGAHLKNHHSHI